MQLSLSNASAGTTTIDIRANSVDTTYNDMKIALVSGGTLGAAYTAGNNTLTVTYDGTSDTADTIAQAITDTDLFTATASDTEIIDQGSSADFDRLVQSHPQDRRSQQRGRLQQRRRLPSRPRSVRGLPPQAWLTTRRPRNS